LSRSTRAHTRSPTSSSTGAPLVPGFQAAGIPIGIKPNRASDLALIVSSPPARAAGVFTKNSVKSAPVLLSRARIRSGLCQAVIINSGNANACTGDRGFRDAMAMCRLTSRALGIDEGTVLVSSTGVIGVPLPMDKIRKGIPEVVRRLAATGIPEVAEAIRTTDRFTKLAWKRFPVDGRTVTVAGMAKGAGMICPQMATMLAYFLTDANAPVAVLRDLLRTGVANSFNRINVDGDSSTNDTVLLLANGLAGNPPLRQGTPSFEAFRSVLHSLMDELARMIVRDGEGSTKTVDILVRGAPTDRDARRIAYHLANSTLVKTSFYGEDMNWGRIVVAVGCSCPRTEQDKIDVSYDDVKVVKGGMSAGRLREEQARRILKLPSFRVTVDLHLGKGHYLVVTSDLSHEYVTLNASYRS